MSHLVVAKRAPEPSRRTGILRHLAVGLLAFLLGFVFARSRMDWSADMRLWRAVGDASFVLLALALASGPLAILFPATKALLPWRRPFGIWFALTGLLHAYLVWDGWALWSLRRLFGYEEIPLESGPVLVLTDPGFGLSNLVGLVALFWGLVIAAVSSDFAMRALGSRGWKYVQQFAYVVFYLAGLHALYFMFLHYNLSLRSLVFQKGVPPPNWFRGWFVALVVLIMLLQLAGFLKTVAMRRAARTTGANAREP